LLQTQPVLDQCHYIHDITRRQPLFIARVAGNGWQRCNRANFVWFN
jgi:hypothetical protein